MSSDTRISEHILKGIQENNEGDNVISTFLIMLLFAESENPGWWKDIYKKLIEYFLKKWGEGK